MGDFVSWMEMWINSRSRCPCKVRDAQSVLLADNPSRGGSVTRCRG